MSEMRYQKIELQNMSTGSYAQKEAYKTLRTNLMFCSQEQKVIGVTSCNPSDGKSTTAINLCRTMTEIGLRVLLVDADMRRSNLVARYGGAGIQSGLSQYLSGQAEKQDTIYETQFPGFHIVVAGYYPPNPVELLDSERFRAFIAEVREEYDYVLLDLPPVIGIVDAVVAAKACDGVMIVVARGGESARRIKACRAQIEQTGTPVIGVVLHTVHTRRGLFGRKNKYYYYQYYRAE